MSVRPFPGSIRAVWAALFVCRAVMLFAGLDRLPLLPSVPDEVIVNAPALALSQRFDLSVFSLAHSPDGLGRLYAHFPPLFTFLQALVFRVWGLTAVSLRASSILCLLAASGVLLATLIELYRRGIVDLQAAAFCGALILLDPTALAMARQGRMDYLQILLGVLAFYWSLLACRKRSPETGLWLAASVAIGLALATHLSAVITWAGFSCWSTLHFRTLRWKRWILVNILPIFVFSGVWLAAYRTGSLEVFRQMRSLAAHAPAPSLLFPNVAGAFRGGSPAGNEKVLAALLFMVSFVVAISGVRFVFSARQRPAGAPAGWWPYFLCLSGILLLQCALLQFVVPASGANRLIAVMPLGMLCLALALSHLTASAQKWAAAAFLLLAVFEVASDVACFGTLRSQWRERSPDRFAAIVNAIPPGLQVTGVPELWFAFRSKGRPYNVEFHVAVDPPARDAREDMLDLYSVRIVNREDSEDVRKAGIGRPVQWLFGGYPDRTFILLAKSPVGLPAQKPAIR